METLEDPSWQTWREPLIAHGEKDDNHEFKCSILSLAPKVSFKRKILEAYFIKTLNPLLINQLNSDILTLFRNGITQFQFPNVCF